MAKAEVHTGNGSQHPPDNVPDAAQQQRQSARPPAPRSFPLHWDPCGFPAEAHQGNCRGPLKGDPGTAHMAPRVSPWYPLSSPTTCARPAAARLPGRPSRLSGHRTDRQSMLSDHDGDT